MKNCTNIQNSKLLLVRQPVQKTCQHCWFMTIAEGLIRPVLICNRKKGTEHRWFIIEPAHYCPNFIQKPSPAAEDFPGPDYENIALIPLTQSKFAILDPAEYPIQSYHRWTASKQGNTYYAVRAEGKKQIRMHRVITNAPDHLVVDHINHNGLDNRKANLRLCTRAQNALNQRPQTGGTSIYKGVAYHIRDKAYHARIYRKGKQIHLGRFKNEIHAALAYDAKAKEVFGEFAHLNFPRPS